MSIEQVLRVNDTSGASPVTTDLAIRKHPGDSGLSLPVHTHRKIKIAAPMGSATVASLATEIVVNLPNISDPIYFAGFRGTSNFNGDWELLVDGSIWGFSKARAPIFDAEFWIKDGHMFIPSGSSVVLRVTNCGRLSDAFNGIIYEDDFS
jgi:hypothetical protein